jgi:hypothetical protein
MALALNVNINRLGICEPRRGFDFLTYAFSSSLLRAKKLVFWNSEIFAHDATTFYWYDTSTGFTSRGSLAAPSNATSIRYVKSQNKNLYVTSSTGIRMTDAVATSLASAGIPKGLTIDLAIASAGSGTALPTHTYATYQYLLAKKDANSNIAYGGVSGRFTIYNSDSGTSNTTATCYIPTGLTTSHFLQLYRTASTTVSGATGEELQLCYEIPIASSDISNGYVTVTDIYPDALLGATIYTAPSQQGATNDSARPPLARDMAEFKTYMFYADIEQPQRLKFSLISVVSPGLVSTDTIIITQGATVETYTAGAAEGVAGVKTFKITTTGTSSQNIDATIKSFIKIVNRESAIVNAYSLSESDTDLPGKVMLEAKTVGAVAFTATSARATAFIPNLPTTATVNNTSAADSYANGLMWSKKGEPEAVPLANLVRVGSSDDRIKRIVALRDALLIFKERDGTFVLTGEDQFHFSVKLLDGTAKVLAPDSIAVVNNFAYGLFEAGICEVSPDGGVDVLSIPIKDQLLPLNGTPLSVVKSLSFGFGTDADGKYILSVPQASTDTYTTKQHVYDVNGHTWCRWDLALSCGDVNPVDTKIYFGAGDSNKIKIERKAYDFTDAADFGATCTISAYTTTSLTIDNTSGMAVGDILYQGSTAIAYIESVDTVAGTVVIDTAQTWTTGTADVTHMKAINCKVQWNPDTGGNAAGLKQYSECSLVQKQAFQKAATIYFSSDLNPAETAIPVTSSSGNGAFGQFLFGDEVFGGEQAKAPKRLGVPRGHARCGQLSVRFENKVAYSDFQLEGIGLTFTPTSTRTTR